MIFIIIVIFGILFVNSIIFIITIMFVPVLTNYWSKRECSKTCIYVVCRVAALNQILIFKYIYIFIKNMDKTCHFPIYSSKFTMLVVPKCICQKFVVHISKLMM